jgi:hypothetical protein
MNGHDGIRHSLSDLSLYKSLVVAIIANRDQLRLILIQRRIQ